MMTFSTRFARALVPAAAARVPAAAAEFPDLAGSRRT